MSTRHNKVMNIIGKFSVPTLLLLGTLALGALDSAAPQFQSGDTICFVGDSITHSGSYHAQILLFHATRFPERRFESYNCGISGDSAAGTLLRYAWDIAPKKPNYATVMLGMNDVGRSNYGRDKTGPEFETWHKQALDSYARNMDKLAEKLAASGCKLVFIKPSLYDQTGIQKTKNLFGVDDALDRCGELCAALAGKCKGGIVDFHTIMVRVNEEGQKADPSFTIVGDDRVHPGATGNMLMAYAFLKAQGVPSIVSDMAVDAEKGLAVRQGNCEIKDIKAGKGSLSFSCKEKSLPFPISDEIRKSLERFIPLVEDLDKETLTVSKLPEGCYDVLIDGQLVQTCSASALASGINLALNARTPQFKQAQKVAGLIWRRHGMEGKLRTLAAVKHFLLREVNPNDLEAENKTLDEQMKKSRENKFQYGVWQIETYRKYKPDAEKLEKEAKDLWNQVFIENQPVSHCFEIRKQGQ